MSGAAMGWTVRHELDEACLEQLCRFYEGASLWWTRDRTRERVPRIVARSDAVVALCDAQTDELLAFARAITDGVIKALVLDVAVVAGRRGEGLGAAVLDALLAHPALAGVRDVELYCLDELVPFYERAGFSAEVGGVRLMRRTAAR